MSNALFTKWMKQQHKIERCVQSFDCTYPHLQRNEHEQKLYTAVANQQQQLDSSLSSCCCCYLESHWSCHCSLQCPPPPPRAGRPSPRGSHRSVLSASSCVPWCSASSSFSSAARWRWPCGSSAWLHTPASAACSSCVAPLCGGRVSCHSPYGRVGASDRSGVRGCPGPCGGAALGSPGTGRG